MATTYAAANTVGVGTAKIIVLPLRTAKAHAGAVAVAEEAVKVRLMFAPRIITIYQSNTGGT